jgi:Zn-dependent alcohol dehydrogenase
LGVWEYKSCCYCYRWGPVEILKVIFEGPRTGEVLAEIKATDLCHIGKNYLVKR